jgi:hypothetical protein
MYHLCMFIGYLVSITQFINLLYTHKFNLYDERIIDFVYYYIYVSVILESFIEWIQSWGHRGLQHPPPHGDS